ncbi:MAG: Nucleotidyltransferase domain protein [Promethearchaeota archaeon]|nr:MAG: Nucleotidyltransferase domain protein [Candidatus Lokiarchaeota archaeon]
MSKERILRNHYREVVYPQEHWALLQTKRTEALKLLSIFEEELFKGYVYGSLARGDVHPNSDIDIGFLYKIPPFKIEYLLTKNNFKNYHREIIAATPSDSIKLYIHLSELVSITVPLTPLTKKNREFYDFGGKIEHHQLQDNLRVPGITKQLILIKPTEKGHVEKSIIHQEHIAAKTVGISIATINERKKVLLRREKHGRTGVFLKRELARDETVEGALKSIAEQNSIIRRKIR